MTLDCAPGSPPPQVGDVLVKPRKKYRITEVRPIESRVWPNRWKVTMVESGLSGGHICWWDPYDRRWTCFHTTSYRRGEGPVEFYGPWPDGVDA